MNRWNKCITAKNSKTRFSSGLDIEEKQRSKIKARHGGARLGKVWRGTVRFGKARQDLAGYGVVVRGEVGQGEVRQGLAWHCKAGCGRAWLGLAGYGTTRHGEMGKNNPKDYDKMTDLYRLLDKVIANETGKRMIKDRVQIGNLGDNSKVFQTQQRCWRCNEFLYEIEPQILAWKHWCMSCKYLISPGHSTSFNPEFRRDDVATIERSLTTP